MKTETKASECRFHDLRSDIEPPHELNNPFSYEPHALTRLAVRQVCDYLETKREWEPEIADGKMFGVLVCRNEFGHLGFLAAYSGQIGGRFDWPWFVPAVFDYLAPTGHFRQEEARISDINRQLEELERVQEYCVLRDALMQLRREGDDAIDSYRRFMLECKQRRDALRSGSGYDEAALIAESQYQKAELRRIRKRWKDDAYELEERLRPFTGRIDSLRRERRQRSDVLQQWLFDNFLLLNDRGEYRSLTDIFADTPQQTPPSGAGECCAPKLLHHAFLHHLQPLCMGEFWQGRSPRKEIRHHGEFYPACRGKCKPILEWMLGLTDSYEENAHDGDIEIVHIDESIIVVNKPAGMLSVPGKLGLPSVESLLGEQYGRVFMPHRLDQDTSGLLVVARTMEAYRHLQRQFLARSVEKEYEALLDGVWLSHADAMPAFPVEGEISLPLCPDIMDRPRQLVDRDHGKPATTHYYIINVENGKTRVLLVPHTGRTHQLRVHCAHQEGLALPIVGDRLYGRAAVTGAENCRLCLHARMLAFQHPVTLRQMRFVVPTPF